MSDGKETEVLEGGIAERLLDLTRNEVKLGGGKSNSVEFRRKTGLGVGATSRVAFADIIRLGRRAIQMFRSQSDIPSNASYVAQNKMALHTVLPQGFREALDLSPTRPTTTRRCQTVQHVPENEFEDWRSSVVYTIRCHIRCYTAPKATEECCRKGYYYGEHQGAIGYYFISWLYTHMLTECSAELSYEIPTYFRIQRDTPESPAMVTVEDARIRKQREMWGESSHISYL